MQKNRTTRNRTKRNGAKKNRTKKNFTKQNNAKKNLSMFCIVLIVMFSTLAGSLITFLSFWIPYQITGNDPYGIIDAVLSDSDNNQESEVKPIDETAQKDPIEESIPKEATEQENGSKGLSEENVPEKDVERETTSEKSDEEPAPEKEPERENVPEEETLDFELPEGTILIEVYKENDGNQKAITLKDGVLQLWLNQNVVCEKRIPIPAQISIGNGFYEIIGNPYISKNDELVLIQSYTTLNGKPKIDYTILASRCKKIIPSLIYDGYVFQNYEGKYGLVYYRDWKPLGNPYAGFHFNSIEDNDFSLPEPTTIWLNNSTVKSVKFGSWGSASYGYQDINAISARLDVESYGELDISFVCELFEPVEVDDDFFDFLDEKFAPQEYEKSFSLLLRTIDSYRRKS